MKKNGFVILLIGLLFFTGCVKEKLIRIRLYHQIFSGIQGGIQSPIICISEPIQPLLRPSGSI